MVLDSCMDILSQSLAFVFFGASVRVGWLCVDSIASCFRDLLSKKNKPD